MNAVKHIYQVYSQYYNVSTDSRSIEENSVFFALKGAHFDANKFALEVAQKKDVVLVVVDDKNLPDHPKFVKVANVLETLQQVANYHRSQMKAKIIAITGTNGKTTTKELIAAVLNKKFSIIKTQGNFNNHIGLPLTLLQIRPETEIAVVEMGANHKKEIETLCQIAQPDMGLITNIGKAHLEGFGGFEGVIEAKKELYDYLLQNDKQVFVNSDNNLLMCLSDKMKRFTYGTNSTADVVGSVKDSNHYLSVKWNNFETEKIVQTHLIGAHNFENIMAAIAVGTYFEVDKMKIIEAIMHYVPTNNRSEIKETSDNKLIMEAYNANPTSMELTIRGFNEMKGTKKMVILGDMFELGMYSENEHREIVKLVDSFHFEEIFLVGKNFSNVAKVKQIKTFETTEALCAFFGSNKPRGFSILIKGSRGMALEKLIPYL
ncbi:MAG: UDP-N-acetylmuramoyl-tripeptide--D-alanyl-D-alanine ligase [Lentimicrobiaceae bacterium]|jgi:UDP-N-acetylmuramoyl-tripeptide--D-alanyl-D-alanine ligase|nr:UDP-N-acetylmuramoyl-tripeptide--D-alanyl-D-alanine ligase [Lentimicrobiaceae bacterium]